MPSTLNWGRENPSPPSGHSWLSAWNSFYMHGNRQTMVPPYPSAAKIWFEICKCGHVCYYNKYLSWLCLYAYISGSHLTLSVSLLDFPSRFQLPTNWLLYSHFEIFAHETHKLVHNKYIYRYILHLECVAGRHCKIWIYIEVLVFLYTHYIIKSFYDISNPLRLIITRKLIRTFTLGLIFCFLKQTNEQSGKLKVEIIRLKTYLNWELN